MYAEFVQYIETRFAKTNTLPFVIVVSDSKQKDDIISQLEKRRRRGADRTTMVNGNQVFVIVFNDCFSMRICGLTIADYVVYNTVSMPPKQAQELHVRSLLAQTPQVENV